MVLESMVVPSRWERHPARMLFIGFFYSAIGLFLAEMVFGKYASISGIFLITIPAVVVMYRAFLSEERKDLRQIGEISLMWEHSHILLFFMYLFLGIVFSYTLFYTLSPPGMLTNSFSFQTETIGAVGQRMAVGAAVSHGEKYSTIIQNNLKVLGFSVLFSLLYGAGAIFLLTLNASLIGVAIGNLMREGLSTILLQTRLGPVFGYFAVMPFAMRYLVHGLPEMAAYFMAALAGGIISEAIVCGHIKHKIFFKIASDAISLLALSVVLIFFSAYLEVYITPNMM